MSKSMRMSKNPPKKMRLREIPRLPSTPTSPNTPASL